MLDPGKLGRLAPPPVGGEPRTGQGKDNFKTSTLKVIVLLSTLSQGEHCGCNKQWGEVRKAEDN